MGGKGRVGGVSERVLGVSKRRNEKVVKRGLGGEGGKVKVGCRELELVQRRVRKLRLGVCWCFEGGWRVGV